MPDEFPVLRPDLQISFYHRLKDLRKRFMAQALARAVELVPVRQIDDELTRFVNSKALTRVAKFGLRGELFFAVPCLVKNQPFLIGYYRLLLGFSQKEFYNKGPFGRFFNLEKKGIISNSAQPEVKALCRSLIGSAEHLVDGIDPLSIGIIRDLQVLTLGPQLRGGKNTRLGQEATQAVYALIEGVVSPYLQEKSKKAMQIRNDSGRTVAIRFSGDPDVEISDDLRVMLSIEIKGGADASNIHNRLGEAEKSHQKAKKRRCFEFWTIHRVGIGQEAARRDSPTTSRFFHLDKLLEPFSPEHQRFCDHLASIIGIRSKN